MLNEIPGLLVMTADSITRESRLWTSINFVVDVLTKTVKRLRKTTGPLERNVSEGSELNKQSLRLIKLTSRCMFRLSKTARLEQF